MATGLKEYTRDTTEQTALQLEQTETVNACEARIDEVAEAMRGTFRQLISVARDYIRLGDATSFVSQLEGLLPARNEDENAA